MNKLKLKELLDKVKLGKTSTKDAFEQLSHFPYEDLEFAKIDHHRTIRQAVPEVIFGQHKTAPQIEKIAGALAKKNDYVLITRIDVIKAKHLCKSKLACHYYPESKCAIIGKKKTLPGRGLIVVASAGTADIPIAEEACITAQLIGAKVERLYDVGVAGLHRIMNHQKLLSKAKCVIVVAGMEGALASVVGGLVACPVIVVPTSIGYGASFQGVAALLTMLNSCAPNVSVVNIDNGFGAGFNAALINRQAIK